MEYRVLGPLEVAEDNRSLPLGGEKQRLLLALLLLNANRVVTLDRIVDTLWAEQPPASAVANIQTYVSRLRKALPGARLLTRPRGYALEVEQEHVDLLRFDRLCREAREAKPERASSLLADALALWRGPALAELDGRFAQIEGRRLEDARLAAVEERINADLALGRHRELTSELEALVAEHPGREGFGGQLMLALYRSGRQADALEAYRDARAALDGVGIEPGSDLKRLEKQILIQDAALDLPRKRLFATPPGEPAPLSGPLVPSSPFPFVGRVVELTTLHTLLQQAEGGQGALVLLTGEPGAGKTRLVRELAHAAAATGVLVLYGVSDAAVSTPYQPLREWLEFLLRVSQPEALRESLGSGGEILARLVPGLAPPTRSPYATTTDLDADRYLLQRAATDALTRISRVHPMLVVADDLHWSDGETLHLLRRLARTAPEARMLVVAALRDRGEEIRPTLVETLADLSSLDAVTRLPLDDLTNDDVAAFIHASMGVEASPETASAVGELADGTPLLLCELWRDLRESGAVEVSKAGVRLTRPVAELRGSERLREIVSHRLSRLRPATGAVVETAAVAGARFEARVLGEAVGLEPAPLMTSLDESAEAGLFEALAEPFGAWRFTHELVRRAVYDRLKRARRIELHLRVAEALEHRHAEGAAPALLELAHHFTLAAPLAGVERAVGYNLRAANAAIGAASYDEATARLATALDLGIADPHERVRVRAQLAYLFSVTGRLTEADEIWSEALDTATALGEEGVAARVRLRRAAVELWSLAADFGRSLKVGEEAIETFRGLGDSRGVADATRTVALALQRRGRLAECRGLLERAVEDARTSGDDHIVREVVGSLGYALWLGPTPVDEAITRCTELLESSRNDRALEAVIRRFLAAFLAMSGRFAEAHELIACSDAVLGELNELLQFWVFRDAAAEAKELLGDRTGAEQELKAKWLRFRDFAARTPDPRAMQPAYLLALMYCDDGRWDDAEYYVAYGRDAPEPIYYTRERILGLAAQARLAGHRGELAEALALAQRSARVADATDVLNYRARVWLTLADVRWLRGEKDEADAAVARAIDLYEQRGNVAAAAHVRASVAAARENAASAVEVSGSRRRSV